MARLVLFVVLAAVWAASAQPEAAFICAADTDCTVAAIDLRTTTFTDVERALARLRTTCCAGVCINTATHTCCGGADAAGSEFFPIGQRKCCHPGLTAAQLTALGFLSTQRTVPFTGECPCTRATMPGGVSMCPASEPVCCIQTRFSNLIPTITAVENPCDTLVTIADNVPSLGDSARLLCNGVCYNPAVRRCCDVGLTYDAGSMQCCSVSGLQSNDIPCPCENDNDCVGASVRDFFGNRDTITTEQRCCLQTAPPLSPVNAGVCSRYATYPRNNLPAFRSNPVGLTQCRGSCIDTRFQMCCNGAICLREYERCCNTTCCNQFTSTCSELAFRGPTVGTLPDNFRSFGIIFTECTSIEKLDELKSFWIFVLPTILGLATLGGLALVLAFASKAAQRAFSFLERAIIFLSVLIILIAILLFFSPIYKYGVVIIFVALFTIVSASVRIRWLNVLVLIALALVLWYILDPFPGNDYLNASYFRMVNGEPFPFANGLWHSLDILFPDNTDLLWDPWRQTVCTEYYNYFRYDPKLLDTMRVNNPLQTTFGYCTRGWIVTLLITSAFMFSFLVALFILVLLALVLRFRKNRMEPIELEVVMEPPAFVPGPVLAPGFGAPIFA